MPEDKTFITDSDPTETVPAGSPKTGEFSQPVEPDKSDFTGGENVPPEPTEPLPPNEDKPTT